MTMRAATMRIETTDDALRRVTVDITETETTLTIRPRAERGWLNRKVLGSDEVLEVITVPHRLVTAVATYLSGGVMWVALSQAGTLPPVRFRTSNALAAQARAFIAAHLGVTA